MGCGGPRAHAGSAASDAEFRAATDFANACVVHDRWRMPGGWAARRRLYPGLALLDLVWEESWQRASRECGRVGQARWQGAGSVDAGLPSIFRALLGRRVRRLGISTWRR